MNAPRRRGFRRRVDVLRRVRRGTACAPRSLHQYGSRDEPSEVAALRRPGAALRRARDRSRCGSTRRRSARTSSASTGPGRNSARQRGSVAARAPPGGTALSLAMSKSEREAFLAALHVGVISISRSRARAAHRADLVRLRARRRAVGAHRARLAQGQAAREGRPDLALRADRDAAVPVRERRGTDRRDRARGPRAPRPSDGAPLPRRRHSAIATSRRLRETARRSGASSCACVRSAGSAWTTTSSSLSELSASSYAPSSTHASRSSGSPWVSSWMLRKVSPKFARNISS